MSLEEKFDAQEVKLEEYNKELLKILQQNKQTIHDNKMELDKKIEIIINPG